MQVYHGPEPGHLRCWHMLCPADLNCKQQRPAGRQLQERPLTTAEKYVRAHLSASVCGCLPSLYRSFLSVSKQQWNPTAAVKLPKNAPHLPNGGGNQRCLAHRHLPASQTFGKSWQTLHSIQHYGWVGWPASWASKNHNNNSVSCHCCKIWHI